MDRIHRPLSQPEHSTVLHWLSLYIAATSLATQPTHPPTARPAQRSALADAGISSVQREEELAKPFWR